MTEPTPATLYPSLTYADAPAAIEWLCAAFGFRKRLVVPGPDGTVMHSELSFGPAVVMVSSPKAEQHRVPPSGDVNTALSLHVEDPDAHFERAKAAGAEILRGLVDEDYGSRGYMVRDPGGHQWYFGTYRPGAYWSDPEG